MLKNKKTLTRQLIGLLVIVVIALGSQAHPSSRVDAQNGISEAQLEALKDELYVEVNRGLLIEGVRPLARNEILDELAQTIADELGAKGSYNSLPRDLADQLDYERWSDNGQRVLRDAINTIGLGTPAEFVTSYRLQMADIVRDTFYRELGVGVSTRVAVEGGNVQYVYVVVMGAQPNVLPVVINDGAAEVYSQQVELYIHNELSLAYETDENTIQQAHSFRLANTEAELENAEWIVWQDNNFAYSWELSSEAGEKSVWAEFEDAKGVRTTYEAKVELTDGPAPTATPTANIANSPITINLVYRGDTLTLQVETERRVVRLQDVYFVWFDPQRFYQLENADALSGVNLSEFPPNACIQIRVRGQNTPVSVDGCETVFVESNEFVDQNTVFWSPNFDTFAVYEGQRQLGECSTASDTCVVQLR